MLFKSTSVLLWTAVDGSYLDDRTQEEVYLSSLTSSSAHRASILVILLTAVCVRVCRPSFQSWLNAWGIKVGGRLWLGDGHDCVGADGFGHGLVEHVGALDFTKELRKGQDEKIMSWRDIKLTVSTIMPVTW